MKYGEYFKAKRIQKNITLTKAAQLLNISSSYLSSIENGSRPAPSFALQQKMADILGLTQKQRYCLYDLAAESRPNPVLAEDLNEYIYRNTAIRNILRYAMECHLSQKDWETIHKYIKRNYLF